MFTNAEAIFVVENTSKPMQIRSNEEAFENSDKVIKAIVKEVGTFTKRIEKPDSHSEYGIQCYDKITVLVNDVLKGDAALKGKEVVITQLDYENRYNYDGQVVHGDMFPCKYMIDERAVFFLLNDSEYYNFYDPHLKVSDLPLWMIPTNNPETPMPTSNTQEPSPTVSLFPNFVDIDEHWAKDVILQAVQKKLFYGMNDTEFAPQGTITRGMFVTVLSRLDGVSSSLTKAMEEFEDVDASAYYATAVKWAHDNEIIFGIGEGIFSPDNPITRQDAATILGRYFTVKGIELPKNKESIVFADDDIIDGYAKGWVYKMQLAGIIHGKGESVFDPLGLTTRAEAAALFVRIEPKLA